MPRTADLTPGYFKFGDDCAAFADQLPDAASALEAWADSLTDFADRLRAAAKAMKGYKVEIQADTHTVTLTGPPAVIAALIAGGVATESE